MTGYVGIEDGLGLYTLEIPFYKCKNNICILVGANGSGKTSILSELHPFASSGSFDVRSDINLILKKKWK